MQIHSHQHRHKLGLTVLLLVLFAIPFALQWRSLKQHDTSAFMAGGAVIGNRAVVTSSRHEPITNNSSIMTTVAGKTLLGALAQ